MNILKQMKEKEIQENNKGLKNFKKWIDGKQLNENEINTIEWLITKFEASKHSNRY